MESVIKNELTSLLKDDLAHAELLGKERVCVPVVNIKRNELTFELKIVAPGIRKEDFLIEINNGVMTVRGQTASIIEAETPTAYTKTYESVSFSREFVLPQNVDAKKMEVNYADEILRVSLPKVQR